MDVRALLHCFQADLVGRADDLSALNPRPGHPDRKAPRIMIAPVALLVEWRAPELPAPDYERRRAQAARLQICEQPCDRFVRTRAHLSLDAYYVAVRGPAAARTGIQLDEAHVPLD